MESLLQEHIPPPNLNRSSWEERRTVTADGNDNEVISLFSFLPNCSALTYKHVNLLNTYASITVINKLINFLGQMCTICFSMTSS